MAVLKYYKSGEWQKVNAPSAAVTSVNGQTGAVTVQEKITGTAGDFVVIGSDGNVLSMPITTTKVEHEELVPYRHGNNYVNPSTFEFVETSAYDYTCTAISQTLGGRVTINWDASQLTQIEFIPYLFKDGVPYKYAQLSVSGTDRITGEWSAEWIDPNTGSGFLRIGAPLSFNIPDGCALMCCFRASSNGHTVIPVGSNYSTYYADDNFIQYFIQDVISISIEKITENIDVFNKLDKYQGEENSNRYMVTNADGLIVAGEINPNSTALRAGWDTVIHRGWISGAYENTLPAFYLAKENGYSWVECDVRMTSDGIPVLAHDATITGVNSNNESITLTVANSTLSDLQTVILENHERFYDIRINTLAELLDMSRVLGIKIFLDIKVGGEAAMKSIAKTVLRYGMSNNVMYMPTSIADAQHIASIDKNASFNFVCFGTDPLVNVNFSDYTTLLTGGNQVNMNVQVNTWAFDEEVIEAINAAGLGLCVWNVTSDTINKAIDSGALYITKANVADAVDLDKLYLADKSFSFDNVAPSWDVIKTISSNEIMYGYSLDKSTTPIGYAVNYQRASYVNFDILVEAGYKYKFDFVSNSSAQIGTQWHNQTALDNYNSGLLMNNDNVYDPGWLNNGAIVTPPATYNGSSIVGVRLTFKNGANSNVVEGFIQSVTISRHPIAY